MYSTSEFTVLDSYTYSWKPRCIEHELTSMKADGPEKLFLAKKSAYWSLCVHNSNYCLWVSFPFSRAVCIPRSLSLASLLMSGQLRPANF